MTYFGHIGAERGGYNIPVCINCHTIVVLSGAEMDRMFPSVLDYLNDHAKCCEAPQYTLTYVIPFEEIKKNE
jgi:hypothetical protein